MTLGTSSCVWKWKLEAFGQIVNSFLVVLEFLKDHAVDSTDCLRSFVIMPLARSVVES